MSELNYNEMAQKSAERYASQILKDIYKGVPESGLRLLKLIEIIPNWETYLTDKQRISAECYIKCLNACEVDYQLNLSLGTAQQRLFGSSTSKGALGRLEEIVKRLEKQGYFEKQKMLQKKQKEKLNKQPTTRTISDRTKEQIKELIKLIADMPDYEKHLTSSQKERVLQFLRLRSIKGCAKYFGITETTFKQSLLGRNGQGGILGRLRSAQGIDTIDNWNDI